MASACRLLLTTRMPVTEICYEVGFGSLGTFTTRFGRLVGASPQQVRWLAVRHARRSMAELASCVATDADADGAAVRGWIDKPPAGGGSR